MDNQKLRKLKRKLQQLRDRQASLTSRELENFARQLGRERHKKRGKEPTYVSMLLPNSRPISIPGPGHLTKYTAGNVLDALERDIYALEE